MPRRAKEQPSSNGHDLSELLPYKDRAKRLKAEEKAAREATADLYIEMKGKGYPKDIIAYFKKAIKLDEIDVETRREREERLNEMCQALKIGHQYELTY